MTDTSPGHPPALTIAKWSEVYEKDNRLKNLHWVSLPVDLGSNGYQSLMDRPDGPALYGCWCALVLLAATMPTRGTLATSRGVGLSTKRLATLSRMPEPLIESLILWALDPAVGWLKPPLNGYSQGFTGIHGESPSTRQDTTRQDKTLVLSPIRNKVSPTAHPPASGRGASVQPEKANLIDVTPRNALLRDVTKSNGKAPDPVPYEEIRVAWNKLAEAEGLPTIRDMKNQKRRKSVAARWNDTQCRDDWQSGAIADKLKERKEFFRDKGFPAFDNLFGSPTNWTKLMENNFRDPDTGRTDLPF